MSNFFFMTAALTRPANKRPCVKKPPDSSRANHPCVTQPAINPAKDLVHPAPLCGLRCSDPVARVRYGRSLTRPPPLLFSFFLRQLPLSPCHRRRPVTTKLVRKRKWAVPKSSSSSTPCPPATSHSLLLFSDKEELLAQRRNQTLRSSARPACDPLLPNWSESARPLQQVRKWKLKERKKRKERTPIAVWPRDNACYRDTGSMVLKGSSLVCQRESVSNVLVTCSFSFFFLGPHSFRTRVMSLVWVCFFFSDRVCYSPQLLWLLFTSVN